MAEETRGAEGMPEEEFSRLLQGVSAMAPLLRGLIPKESSSQQEKTACEENGAPQGCTKREALLIALKPYLSPARCEAVDYFIRLSRVGDAIRALH